MLAQIAALLAFRRPAPAAPDERELVSRALSGRDAEAEKTLIRRVSLAIRARILCVTRGRAGPGGADVEDLIHETWCRLLENDGRRLRAWDPALGKTLEGYVSLVATQWISTSASHANRQKRAPAGGLESLDSAHEVREPAANPETAATEAQDLGALWSHLEGALPDRGRVILKLMYVDGVGPAEAA